MNVLKASFKELKETGLNNKEITELCSTVLNICAFGVDDDPDDDYKYLRTVINDIHPGLVKEKSHPLYNTEVKEYEVFAFYHLQAVEGLGTDDLD